MVVEHPRSVVDAVVEVSAVVVSAVAVVVAAEALVAETESPCCSQSFPSAMKNISPMLPLPQCQLKSFDAVTEPCEVSGPLRKD